MKAIIIGASGMIGKGVLLECIDHSEVTEILTIGRTAPDVTSPKLKFLHHPDFNEFESIRDQLKGYDACFYCMGVSAAGMSETEYSHVTYNYCMALANVLHSIDPNMTFTYISGQGTDSTEKGRMMWARVKGKLENDILALGFKKAVMLRPGMIEPLRGIKSKTKSYQFMYDYFGWLLTIMKWISPNSITDTTRLGKAMINSHLKEAPKSILDPIDINALSL